MAPNIEALREVLDTIHSTPMQSETEDGILTSIEWDQEVYRESDSDNCSTALCFAGWTVELSRDWQWVSPHNDEAQHADGRWASACEAATEILGLTEETADALFHAWNDLGEIGMIVAQIENGEIA